MNNVMGNMAHLGLTGNRYCALPDNFDLAADYVTPRSYQATEVDKTGQRLSGKVIRVRVDHDATGTGTPGTGDTVVRRI